jgi:hypothetical protein
MVSTSLVTYPGLNSKYLSSHSRFGCRKHGKQGPSSFAPMKGKMNTKQQQQHKQLGVR